MTQFQMKCVVDLIERVEIPVALIHTGGGCATIYTGTDEPATVAAGPGVYRGSSGSESIADTLDFYIGPDDEGESDDFVTVPADWTALDIAREIIRQHNRATGEPSDPLTQTQARRLAAAVSRPTQIRIAASVPLNAWGGAERGWDVLPVESAH